MDALTSNVSVTGPELVKAVSALMPEANIAVILDQTNTIHLPRVLGVLKSQKFDTVFHLVETIWVMGLTEENAREVLSMMITYEYSFSQELRADIRKLIASGLFNSIYKFVKVEEPVAVKRCGCF
jgi:hypothetical protein